MIPRRRGEAGLEKCGPVSPDIRGQSQVTGRVGAWITYALAGSVSDARADLR